MRGSGYRLQLGRVLTCLAFTARVTAVVLLLTTSTGANSDAPPNGYSGAAGEETCAASGCHDTTPVGSEPGELRLYAWSQDRRTVYLSFLLAIPDSVMTVGRWGFEATVTDTLGEPVGQWLLTDTVNTQIGTDSAGGSYIKQTADGAALFCCNEKWWDALWIRTDSETPYFTLYVSGLAGNGDSTRAGDLVYAAQLASTECKVDLTGDVNDSRSLTSADIIFLIGHLFKGLPGAYTCPGVGDVNCDGAITVGDVIYLVNHIFKDGPVPCDVCAIVPDAWFCF